MFGGRGEIYNHDFDGSYGAIPTFSNGPPPDGNRCLTYTSRNAQHWRMRKCVLNRNGVPPDTSPSGTSEMCKLEGTDNSIVDSVIRNSVSHGHAIDSGSWSWFARGGRVAHSVYQNFNGPIAVMRDWLDDGAPGSARLNDYKWLNCIFDQVALNPYSSWIDHLLVSYLSAGVDWTNVIQMHGITVRDSAGRDGDDFEVTISRGNGPGTRSINYMLANYPANFSNWTFVTANPFTASLSAATNIKGPDIPTWYTPGTTANGVALTTVAAGDSGSGTSLVVNDSRCFPDPRYVSSDGSIKELHCNGANRQFTAVNFSTHTFTMATGFSRSAGMAVNLPITSGSTPNRGAVR